METLLRNDFTTHYGLPVSTTPNLSLNTNATYFELKDDVNLVYTVAGDGVAKYNNTPIYSVTVINYELFVNSLPHHFRQGRLVCDLIVCTNQNQHFLLNELTDSKPEYVDDFVNSSGHRVGKRNKAIAQLLNSLNDLMSVPTINTFAASHTYRRCCFFNKQAPAPPSIRAITAFNRLSTVVLNGLQMPSPAIEAHGFQLWEYSGSQVYSL